MKLSVTKSYKDLPQEILLAICFLLNGWELLNLSKVSKFWRNLLFKCSEKEWSRRLGHTGNSPEDYESKLTLLLETTTGEGLRKRGGGIWLGLNGYFRTNRKLSLEIWFVLSDVAKLTDQIITGGILLGGQSTSMLHHNWPQFHQQFIIIDKDLNFYCSFSNQVKTSLGKVQTKIWNHLVVTFDLDEGKEEVYLNGKVVSSRKQVQLHEEFEDCTSFQVGTGVISAGGIGKPSPEYCDWYGFNGLIDSVKSYNRIITDVDVLKSYKGEVSLEEGMLATGPNTNVHFIQTTRPHEGGAVRRYKRTLEAEEVEEVV